MTMKLLTIPAFVAAFAAAACSPQTATETATPPPAAAPADATGTAPPPGSPTPLADAAPSTRPPAPRSEPRAATTPAAPLKNTGSTPVAPEPAPARPTSHEVTVPTGTALPLELLTPVNSETATIGTEVRARLQQAIVVGGDTVIPNGATLTGTVTDVERSGRVQGRARVALRFTEVSFSGERETLRTDPLTFEAEATKKADATKVGAGAGIGAVIGGILGGGKGAAQGAAIGGAAGGGAVLATRGKEVDLASGSSLTATLAAPVRLTVED
jgi:hypothetical protein